MHKAQRVRSKGMEVPMKARCIECGRVFDLTKESDAAEWHYGHDCEV